MSDPMDIRNSVFARAYDEVLSALKHQDDKLNRTLTAIAFLTAAGITLFVRVGVGANNAGPQFPESGWSIRGVLFAIFLVSVVLAVTLALAAIGPGATYPWPRQKNEAERRRSLIFYALIARDRNWDEFLNWNSERLRAFLSRNFHDEAQTIAHRVNYKMARSRESAAFVQLTVVALSLLGIFSIQSFSIATQWWMAVSLLLTLLALPFADLWYMLDYQYLARRPRWESYGFLGLTFLWAALLLSLAPSHDAHWPAAIYALLAFLLSRLGVVHPRVAPVYLVGPAVGGFILVLVFVCQ